MNRLMSLLAVGLLLSVPARAQTGDPAGHWEGTIQAPQTAIPLEVDLARDTTGALAGTLDMPGEHIKGLPLAKVIAHDGRIEFAAREDQTISGVLSPDGQTFTGSFNVAEGSAPVSLRRTGPARIEPAPAIAPVAADLQGHWAGTLDAGGRQVHLLLTIVNVADHAAAKIVNQDEGNLAVPVSAIDRSGASITLEFRAVGSSYVATLAAEGTELTGTYTQGAFSAPLTFRRAK